MKMKWIRACLLVIGFCVAGCGRREAPAEFVLVTPDEHKHLDPQKISWSVDLRIAQCMFEALLNVDPKDLSLEPGVADRWQVSDGGLIYTFHLRRDAMWSNGDALTAGDFIYAWRRALLPDMAADYTQLLFYIDGARDFFNWRQKQLDEFKADDAGAAQRLWLQTVDRFEKTVGISSPDDRTLVVRLEQPTPYFLELVAFVTFMPVHQASVERTEELNPETGWRSDKPGYWTNPNLHVSNGPYVLKRRRFKEYLLLVANDRYWNRAAMKNTSILEKIITNPQTALLAYRSGKAHWLPDVPTASSLAADLAAQQRADVHLQPIAGVYFYNFNCSETLADGSANPLADRRVRQALSMGIDRRLLVEQVTRLNQPLVKSFVPPGVVDDYDPPAEAGFGFAPDKARQLLSNAGYPDGRGLSGLSILYNTGSGHEKIAEAIQRMWEQHLGVEVVLEGVESLSFSDRLKKHNFTICRASWIGDYRDPTTWLGKMATDDGNNDCAYSNAEYDALLAQAAKQTDRELRLATLRRAEAMMLADSPMAMLHQYLFLHVFDPNTVQGLQLNAWCRYRLERVSVR